MTPTGAVTSRYDKVRRVPFGEYVPLRGLLETLGAPVDEVPSDAVAGTAPGRARRTRRSTGQRTRPASVISWEVFFGGRVREGVRDGGGVILNPTNGASYTGTILQTQQIASSRLRAIETGRWVVQVSPTGFSRVRHARRRRDRAHGGQRAGGDPSSRCRSAPAAPGTCASGTVRSSRC